MAKIPKRVIKLTFEQYPDVEIVAGSISVAEAMVFDELPREQMFDKFGGLIKSWNLEEDDGTPIPAGVEGMRSLEVGFAFDVVQAWTTAITGVSDPLDRPSTDGLPWEAPNFPTEALSASQPN